MCTFSFLPQDDQSYLVVMNRDEQRTRVDALPPRVSVSDGPGGNAVYPQEPEGGTWIGSNARGLTLALLNWYEKMDAPLSNLSPRTSRGVLIPELIPCENGARVGALLSRRVGPEFLPFRLISVDAQIGFLCEWAWDGRVLEARPHPWAPFGCFSSAYREREVAKMRRITWANEVHPQNLHTSTQHAGYLLQVLHASHLPEKGPFSICMHRPDAVTVSCTAVEVSRDSVVMTYRPGSPCESGEPTQSVLERIL